MKFSEIVSSLEQPKRDETIKLRKNFVINGEKKTLVLKNKSWNDKVMFLSDKRKRKDRLKTNFISWEGKNHYYLLNKYYDMIEHLRKEESHPVEYQDFCELIYWSGAFYDKNRKMWISN